MTALCAPAALVLAAIAIDFGALYSQRRDVQSVADLAAISAVASLASADKAVTTTLLDNGAESVRIATPKSPSAPPKVGETVATIVHGTYEMAGGIEPGQRFRPGRTPTNAVQVTLETLGTRLFGEAMMEAPLISAQGVARIAPAAVFSVGSRLAKVEGGLANAVIGGLLGANISLSVMDYEALLKADVGLLDFLDALASEVKVTGGSYSDLLGTTVTVGQIARALAEVPGLDRRSQIALAGLGQSANKDLALNLKRVIDLGQAGYLSLGGRPAALSMDVNALQVLTASAALANGRHQLAIDLGASIPGLLSARLDLAIGEPPQLSPWLTLGEAGAIVRTAQTRLLLTAEIGGSGVLAGASIKLPIYLELAFAEATLSDITCTGGNPATIKVTVAARPGVADVRIAEINASRLSDFAAALPSGRAQLVKTPILTVSGEARLPIANTSSKPLGFVRADIDKASVQTVATTDIARSLAGALTQNLDLSVKVLGIDLGLSGLVKSTVGTLLAAAAPALDQLLNSVLAALGVSIGQADVRVHAASCGRPVLVQ